MDYVFISYAREDLAFVHRLHTALTDRERESWVDWERIPKGAEWLAEIYAAIDSAEAFLFVISPDSITSPVCADELKHAMEHNKRLFPIVRREVEAESVDNALARLNWIFFRDSDDFDASLQHLLTAFDTDLEWVHAHTRLLVRAVEWDKQKRETSYTLRGRDLKDAEDWLVHAADKNPKPTNLMTQYVLVSRRAVTVRQRVIFGAIAIGMIVVVALSVVAYFQNQEKMRQEKIALARQLIYQAEALRDQPERLEESVRTAVRALTHFKELDMPSVEADQAVRRGMALLPELAGEYDFDLGEIGAEAAAFDPTGRFLAVADKRSRVLVWDTVQERQHAAWPHELPAMASVLAVDIGTDGAHLVTLTYDASRNVDTSTVTVWRLPEGKPLILLQRRGRMDKLRLSPTVQQVYVGMGGSWWGWQLDSGEALEALGDDRLVYDLAFSPDGRHMAMAFRERGSRERIVRISTVGPGEESQRWVERERIDRLEWTADSRKILIGTPRAVLSREATTGRLMASYPRNGSGFLLSPDERLMAEQRKEDYTVQVREASTGDELFRLIHPGEVQSLAFRPNSRSIVTLAVDTRKKFRIWKLEGSRWFAELGHDDPITRVGFSSDARLVFTGSAARERWWTLPAKQEALERPRESSSEGIVANSRQYQARASGWPVPPDAGNRVDILNARGEHITRLEFPSPVLAAAMGRDGRRLAVTTGNITRGGWELDLETWDVNRLERLGTTPYPGFLEDEYTGFLAFSPDDRFIVTASQTGFTFWEAGKLTRAGVIYHPAPQTMAFQHPGTWVATAGRDRTIHVWDRAQWLEMARIVEIGRVKELALSPDGRWLATLSDDGIARLWLLQPDDLIAQACTRLRVPCP